MGKQILFSIISFLLACSLVTSDSLTVEQKLKEDADLSQVGHISGFNKTLYILMSTLTCKLHRGRRFVWFVFF